jgi:hemerythrin
MERDVMESFKWGKEFVTGLPKVDDQHRQLVAMVNDFGKVIAENTSTGGYLFSIFGELAAYAREHFDTEEKLMGQMGVDIRHIKAHVQQHADFVTDVTSIAGSIDVENSEDCRVLLEFLIHWLAYHILGTDQNMARQIGQIQAGETPEAAYNNGEREANSSTEPLVAALSGLFAIVSKRNKALSELNRTLEMRVAERTEELVKTNEALEKISITDPLTELPNRRFATGQLQLLLEESRRGNRPLSCMMVDADGFKMINDTYGHDAGDVVLKRLAQELRHSVRSDDIVCRLGGDEFLVICPNTDLEGALFLGGQIREKIASLTVSAGDGYWVGSVSIGVACTTPERNGKINSLLKAADEAVYEAKKCGRNCVKAK